MTKSTSVVAEIVERVAEREGVDPLTLHPTLYDAIDIDALDVLVNEWEDRQGRGQLRVTFTYRGYGVTVDGEGKITIGWGDRNRKQSYRKLLMQ